MTNDEYFNMAMSHIEEASNLHNLIRTINLRFHDNPVRPVLVQLLSNLRNEELGLGLSQLKNHSEWKNDGIFQEQKLTP